MTEELDDRIQQYDSELFDESVRLTTRSAQGPLETLTETSDDVHAAALTLARAASTPPGIRDLSNHLLAVGRL
ncbi:MAG: hypothetical protein QM607_05900 [Microbacterium sp.]